MPTREEIVREAREWIGTPFLHHGRMKGVGVDCLGLLIGVCRNTGAVGPDEDLRDYSRQPDPQRLIAELGKYVRRIPIDEATVGDSVVLRWQGEPTHFAILGDYLHGGLSLIHSVVRGDRRGKVVEHRLDATHRARIYEAFALPGVS